MWPSSHVTCPHKILFKGLGMWLGPPEDSTPHLLAGSALTQSIMVGTVTQTLYASSPGQKFRTGISVTWQITLLKCWRHFELTNFVFFYNKHLSRSQNALSTICNELTTSWSVGKMGKRRVATEIKIKQSRSRWYNWHFIGDGHSEHHGAIQNHLCEGKRK